MYDNEGACPICMNDFEKDCSGNRINYAVTNCGHVFCLSCLIISSFKKDECPICRNIYFKRPQFTGSNNNNYYNTFTDGEDEVSNWYFGNIQERMQETSRLFYNDFFDFQVDDISLNAFINDNSPPSYASIVRDISNTGIFNVRNAEYFAYSDENDNNNNNNDID